MYIISICLYIFKHVTFPSKFLVRSVLCQWKVSFSLSPIWVGPVFHSRHDHLVKPYKSLIENCYSKLVPNFGKDRLVVGLHWSLRNQLAGTPNFLFFSPSCKKCLHLDSWNNVMHVWTQWLGARDHGAEKTLLSTYHGAERICPA